MADFEDKKISDLERLTGDLTPQSLFETSYNDSQMAEDEFTTRAATVEQVGRTIVNDIEYASELDTVAKTIIDAINEVNEKAGHGGGGSTVTIADNPEGGIDITVDGDTYTVLKKNENIELKRESEVNRVDNFITPEGVSVVRFDGDVGKEALALSTGEDWGLIQVSAWGDGEDKSAVLGSELTGSYLTMDDVTIKASQLSQVLTHEQRIEALEQGGGGGGSTVAMSDNPDGGVDLTVDGTTKTLAKEGELATIKANLSQLDSEVVKTVLQNLTTEQKAIAKSNIDATRITSVVLDRPNWTKANFDLYATQGRNEPWLVYSDDIANSLVIGDIITINATLTDCNNLKGYILVQVYNKSKSGATWYIGGKTLFACTQNYSKVDDVQIDGKSILDSNNVANIPLATTSRIGAVKVGAGLYMRTASGELILDYATGPNVNNRTPVTSGSLTGINILPVTLGYLDYAVKMALTDGKGAEYTDTEKANARARIGAVGGTYELIEDITLEESAPTFERSTEPDGTPYKFDGVFVSVSNASMPNTGNLTFATYNNNTFLCWEFLEVYAGNARTFSKVYNDRGLTSIENFSGLSGNVTRLYRRLGLFNNGLFLPITKIRFQDYTLPVGTNIKIYGIRL